MMKLSTNCIESKKSINANGYSRISIKGKMFQAHRWAFELINGQVSNSLVIDHICGNRACVAPDHLRAVTQSENILAGKQSIDSRTHCNNGHLFEGNLIYRKDGRRECGECNRIRARRNYLRKRASAV